MDRPPLIAAIHAARRVTGSAATKIRIVYNALSPSSKGKGAKRGRGRPRTVVRTIRPYAWGWRKRGAVLYASDTLHGGGVIHSFYLDRIVKATLLPKPARFTPHWTIRISGPENVKVPEVPARFRAELAEGAADRLKAAEAAVVAKKKAAALAEKRRKAAEIRVKKASAKQAAVEKEAQAAAVEVRAAEAAVKRQDQKTAIASREQAGAKADVQTAAQRYVEMRRRTAGEVVAVKRAQMAASEAKREAAEKAYEAAKAAAVRLEAEAASRRGVLAKARGRMLAGLLAKEQAKKEFDAAEVAVVRAVEQSRRARNEESNAKFALGKRRKESEAARASYEAAERDEKAAAVALSEESAEAWVRRNESPVVTATGDQELVDYYSPWGRDLSDGERAALTRWSGGEFDDVNEVLRGERSPSKDAMEIIDGLRSAMKKAPRPPEGMFVYRKLNPRPGGELDKLLKGTKVGEVKQFDGFNSTTTHPLGYEDVKLGKQPSYVLEIRPQQGVWVKPFAKGNVRDEDELLMPDGMFMRYLGQRRVKVTDDEGRVHDRIHHQWEQVLDEGESKKAAVPAAVVKEQAPAIAKAAEWDEKASKAAWAGVNAREDVDDVAPDVLVPRYEKWLETADREDVDALKRYSFESSDAINDHLRAGKRFTPADAFLGDDVPRIDRLLDQAPDPPDGLVVYRFMDLDIPVEGAVRAEQEAFKKRLLAATPGTVQQFDGYMSTTTAPGQMAKDGWNVYGYAMEIRARRGAVVSQVAAIPEEAEFLMPRGSRLRYVGKRRVNLNDSAGLRITVHQWEEVVPEKAAKQQVASAVDEAVKGEAKAAVKKADYDALDGETKLAVDLAVQGEAEAVKKAAAGRAYALKDLEAAQTRRKVRADELKLVPAGAEWDAVRKKRQSRVDAAEKGEKDAAAELKRADQAQKDAAEALEKARDRELVKVAAKRDEAVVDAETQLVVDRAVRVEAEAARKAELRREAALKDLANAGARRKELERELGQIPPGPQWEEARAKAKGRLIGAIGTEKNAAARVKQAGAHRKATAEALEKARARELAAARKVEAAKAGQAERGLTAEAGEKKAVEAAAKDAGAEAARKAEGGAKAKAAGEEKAAVAREVFAAQRREQAQAVREEIAGDVEKAAAVVRKREAEKAKADKSGDEFEIKRTGRRLEAARRDERKAAVVIRQATETEKDDAAFLDADSRAVWYRQTRRPIVEPAGDAEVSDHYDKWVKGLSDEEVSAVGFYTQSSDEMNGILRGVELDLNLNAVQEARTAIKGMRSALAKAPPPPEDLIVYRKLWPRPGGNLEKLLDGAKVGTVEKFEGFNSTSLDPVAYAPWMGKPYMMEIRPKRGAYIARAADLLVGEEQEFLMVDGARMRYLGNRVVQIRRGENLEKQVIHQWEEVVDDVRKEAAAGKAKEAAKKAAAPAVAKAAEWDEEASEAAWAALNAEEGVGDLPSDVLQPWYAKWSRGVTPEEQRALDRYTGGETFDEVNAALKSGKPAGEKAARDMKALDGMLERAPEPPAELTIYRVVDFDEIDPAQKKRMLGVKRGDVETLDGYTSATTAPGAWSKERWGLDGEYVMEIRPLRGAQIADLGSGRDVAEYLLPAQTRLRYVGRREVTLKEADGERVTVHQWEEVLPERGAGKAAAAAAGEAVEKAAGAADEVVEAAAKKAAVGAAEKAEKKAAGKAAEAADGRVLAKEAAEKAKGPPVVLNPAEEGLARAVKLRKQREAEWAALKGQKGKEWERAEAWRLLKEAEREERVAGKVAGSATQAEQAAAKFLDADSREVWRKVNSRAEAVGTDEAEVAPRYADWMGGLSRQEEEAIAFYKASSYELNSVMRGLPVTPRPHVDMNMARKAPAFINSALDRAPDPPEGLIVYRKVYPKKGGVLDTKLKGVKPGEVEEFDGFNSASLSPGAYGWWREQTPYVMQIRARRGAYIEKIGPERVSEQEFLMRAGVRLRYLGERRITVRDDLGDVVTSTVHQWEEVVEDAAELAAKRKGAAAGEAAALKAVRRAAEWDEKASKAAWAAVSAREGVDDIDPIVLAPRYEKWLGSADKEDVAALKRFSSEYEADAINDYLRSGKQFAAGDEYLAADIPRLDRLLEQAPDPPEGLVVYRFLDLDMPAEGAVKAQLETFRKRLLKTERGDVQKFDGYMSTTTAPGKMATDGWDVSGYAMEIRPRRGGLISSVSDFAEEAEVLLPRGSRLRYVGKRQVILNDAAVPGGRKPIMVHQWEEVLPEEGAAVKVAGAAEAAARGVAKKKPAAGKEGWLDGDRKRAAVAGEDVAAAKACLTAAKKTAAIAQKVAKA